VPEPSKLIEPLDLGSWSFGWKEKGREGRGGEGRGREERGVRGHCGI